MRINGMRGPKAKSILSEELAMAAATSAKPVPSAPPVPSIPPAPPNRRPDELGKLLFEGDFHTNFHSVHKGMNRFYVININYVFRTKLDLNPGKLSKYSDIIESEQLPAAWSVQYPGEYLISHTQMNKRKIHSAKSFEKAVTAIVAMEVVARHLKSTLNVYDHLRIVAAFYFVDNFDKEKYTEIQAYCKAEKKALFGKLIKHASEAPFHKVYEAYALQPSAKKLLEDMSKGHCVTEYVGNKLVTLINECVPSELHVGPVLRGDDARSNEILGTRNTSKHLRVPKSWDVGQLQPCF